MITEKEAHKQAEDLAARKRILWSQSYAEAYAKLSKARVAGLWQLSPEQFNEWRRVNDYPQIFSIFERKLPYFQEWMESQEITRNLVFQHGIAQFISTEEPLVTCEYKDGDVKLYLKSFEKLPHLKKIGWIINTKEYQPYLCWIKRKVKKKEFESIKESIGITGRNYGQIIFMDECYLLNIGGIKIQNPNLSGRLMDFICIDDVQLIGAHSNQQIHLWHSSAIGLDIHGDLAFLDAYRTAFWDRGFGRRKRQLKLTDGIFQDLHFKDCDINLHATRSTIHRSSVNGIKFDATLEHTNIDQSSFDAGAVRYKNYAKREKFYAKIKALYASLGKNKEAGDYFYKEKINEMQSLLFPWLLHSENWFLLKNLEKLWLTVKCWFKFSLKFVNFLAWGFGERPFRSIATSIVAIIFCAMVYYFSEGSTTHKDTIDSIYFSVVTFTTLGYGDISQKDAWLKLLAALEAFGGMVLMGLFLGGFASKSKQY